MTVQIDRFTSPEVRSASLFARPVAPTREPAAAVQPRPVTDAEATGTLLGEVPPAPTPEARKMVDRAAERVEQLHAQNRELHFTTDAVSKRVVIEVRDLDGKLIKTIPPAKALDVMSGAEL